MLIAGQGMEILMQFQIELGMILLNHCCFLDFIMTEQALSQLKKNIHSQQSFASKSFKATKTCTGGSASTVTQPLSIPVVLSAVPLLVSSLSFL